jgi:tetratricopeptide (TPR) repeat protein
MDGRWPRFLIAGAFAGALGCTMPHLRSSGEAASKSESAALKQLKEQQQKQAAATAAPVDKNRKLKPETLVKVGALKETAADDVNRPQVERDAFRYQARQSYQKAIDQNPKFTQGYLALASSYLRTDENDKAHAVFQKGLAANPRDAALWFEHGTVYAREKNFTQSVECFAQAVQLDPENKHYQKTYGLQLARVGRFDEACEVLGQCMSEAEARYTVARMCHHLQQPDLCRQQLEAALRANPNHAGAKELLETVNPYGMVRPAGYEEPAIRGPKSE